MIVLLALRSTSVAAHPANWLGPALFTVLSFQSHQPLADPLPTTPLERSCWLSTTGERTKPILGEGRTSVRFGNVRDGDIVVSPFRVDFAARGIGIAPAGHAINGTGHHHLLVDTLLPTVPTERLPFTDHHVHFGKGQVSTVLNLQPGPHTLQLLFADHDHRPYYIFSPKIRIYVVKSAGSPPRVVSTDFDRSSRSWCQHVQTRPRIPGEYAYFANVRELEVVRSPLTIKFGAEGVPIGARSAAAPGTGYFSVEVRSEGGGAKTLDLSFRSDTSRLGFPRRPPHTEVETSRQCFREAACRRTRGNSDRGAMTYFAHSSRNRPFSNCACPANRSSPVRWMRAPVLAASARPVSERCQQRQQSTTTRCRRFHPSEQLGPCGR